MRKIPRSTNFAFINDNPVDIQEPITITTRAYVTNAKRLLTKSF